MRTKVTIKKGPVVSAAFNDLLTRDVVVGIPGGEARQPLPGEKAAPPNYVLGYLMETGVPERNIPARPFLVPGIEAVRDTIAATLKKAVPLAMAGDRGAVQRALDKVGLIASSAVQEKITDGPFEPLSPKTLKRRKARGFQGERPLIETGQLRRSVTYTIREKGPHND